MKLQKKWMWLLLASLIFAAGGESSAFEGRMAGMADPYGLVYDDSDFLIHPSRITDGQGVSYYGYYKFTYTDVSGWSWKTPDTLLYGYADHTGISGDRYDHDALVGTAFPVGKGRLGLFFNYTGTRSDYSGDYKLLGWTGWNVSSDADNFAFRAVYGLPLGGSVKFGAEAQLSYHTGVASTLRTYSDATSIESLLNYPWDNFPTIRPYDYSYWEYQLKAGLQGDIGPVTFGATVRGGSIFSGDNEIYCLRTASTASSVTGYFEDLKGGVEGYNVGSDIWLRYPVNERLALPFLLKIDYLEKSYTGGPTRYYYDSTADSILSLVPTNWVDTYRNDMDLLKIEVGGGVDYTCPSGLKLAAGLYYDFIKTDDDVYGIYNYDDGTSEFTSLDLFTSYPAATEHQIKLRLAAEKPLCPEYVLRAGLEAFHGWVNEDYTYSTGVIYPSGSSNFYPSITGSLSGSRWGILGSIGMTARLRGVEIEPFIQGGWQQLSVDDPGAVVYDTVLRLKREYECSVVAAGLAIKF